MTLTKSLLCGLAALVLVQTALAVDKVADAKKDADLKLAATALERMNILSEDSDWVYDFNTNPLYSWAPGSVLNANAATFPAATGYGLTVALLNLGPCSMLPPHLHPRATNFVVAVNGTTETYMIQENGARTIKQTLKQGQLTIFPAGSLHTMQNKGTFTRWIPVRRRPTYACQRHEQRATSFHTHPLSSATLIY